MSIGLKSDSSGTSGSIVINGSDKVVVTSAGNVTAGTFTGAVVGNVTGNVTGSLTAGGSVNLATTTVSTSGTAIDFTSIPSWAKKVSVLFNKVGISGTSNMLVQLGTSGGIQGTNYEAQASVVNASVATLNSTSGFPIRNVEAAARISGIMTIAGMGSNLWVMSGTLTVIGGVASVQIVAGVIQLSGVLDRVRINALAAETFDEGSLNIMYEG
jgi:hypothetical protein